MLETNSEKTFAGIIIFVALLLIYLLLSMPTPTAEGYCVSDCTRHTMNVDYPHFDSEQICGLGCYAEYVHESVTMQGFTVGCICCDCVGSNDLELPDCEPPLGFIYKILGRCK